MGEGQVPREATAHHALQEPVLGKAKKQGVKPFPPAVSLQQPLLTKFNSAPGGK